MARVNRQTRHITKKNQNKYIKELRRAATLKNSVEAEIIAPIYRNIISDYFDKDSWEFDQNTDGFFVDDGLFMSLRLLLEAKYDKDLRNIHDRAAIVAQCIYYMKKFETSGHDQPNVIFGADQDQMFAVYAPPLRRYLAQDHDWSISPSSAAQRNPQLIKQLIDDRTLATFVFDINDSAFNLNDVMQAIDDLSKNEGEYDKIRITPQNIRAVFDSFLTMLDAKKLKKSIREDFISLFITSLIGGPTAPRVDAAKKNTIHLSNGKTLTGIDTIAYSAFFARYETIYTDSEIATITATYDVLIEELNRRRSGDYWTPTIWADEAHRALNKTFGNTWRDDFVVWDNCCGTKNLTRDYKFKELYLSTLFEYELDSAAHYNPEAEAFAYDFLNDDLQIGPEALLSEEWKMPRSLYKALSSDKPILFLINPPYATSTNQGETSKEGVSLTGISQLMRKEKGYNKATQQLYTQFLFRILDIKKKFDLSNVAIGIFSPKRFMTGTNGWSKFMNDFQDHFKFESGFYFNAGEFTDVKSKWGISFTIWSTRKFDDTERNIFKLALAESTPSGINTFGEDTIYNLEQNDLLSEWLKEQNIHKEPKKLGPQLHLKGAIKPYDSKGSPSGHLTESAFGYLHNNGNSVEHSGPYVGIYSAAFGSGHGVPITPDNFERACVVLSVRKSLIPDPSELWINCHDNFHRPFNAPAEDSPLWREFIGDCVVASLFSRNGSNQSALRDIEYNGNVFDLHNEFFFMSYSEIKELAIQHNMRSVEIDIKNHGGSRYVHNWLANHADQLSTEAKLLISEVKELVSKTFPYRSDSYVSNDNHLSAWDAGYRQIYNLAQAINEEWLAPCNDAFEILQTKIADQATDFKFIN